MKLKAKERLRQGLQDILSKLRKLDGRVRPPVAHQANYRGQGVSYAYDQPTADLMATWWRNLLKETGLQDKVSEEAARYKFRETLGLLFSQESPNFDKAIDECITGMQERVKEHVVFLPIFGIDLKMRYLRIGRVTFSKVDPEWVAKEAAGMPPEFTARLVQILGDGTFARYAVLAEPQKAKELAVAETRRALDILRYAIIALGLEENARMMIALEDEFKLDPKCRYVPIFPEDRSSFSIHFGAEGPEYRPLVIDRHLVPRMRDIGVFKLSEILQKPLEEATKFQERLLRSVKWFADAQFQSENENKLLGLVTSMEVLFNPKDREQLANSIAEGVAIVSAATLAERRTVRERVKAHYSNRSTISHGGTETVTDAHVDELLGYAQRALVALVGMMDRFKTKQDLEDWLLDQRLSPALADRIEATGEQAAATEVDNARGS